MTRPMPGHWGRSNAILYRRVAEAFVFLVSSVSSHDILNTWSGLSDISDNVGGAEAIQMFVSGVAYAGLTLL